MIVVAAATMLVVRRIVSQPRSSLRPHLEKLRSKCLPTHFEFIQMNLLVQMIDVGIQDL